MDNYTNALNYYKRNKDISPTHIEICRSCGTKSAGLYCNKCTTSINKWSTCLNEQCDHKCPGKFCNSCYQQHQQTLKQCQTDFCKNRSAFKFCRDCKLKYKNTWTKCSDCEEICPKKTCADCFAGKEHPCISDGCDKSTRYDMCVDCFKKTRVPKKSCATCDNTAGVNYECCYDCNKYSADTDEYERTVNNAPERVRHPCASDRCKELTSFRYCATCNEQYKLTHLKCIDCKQPSGTYDYCRVCFKKRNYPHL
jgi:hypothetical protein